MAVKKICTDAKKHLENTLKTGKVGYTPLDPRALKQMENMLNNERILRMSEKEPYRSSVCIGLHSGRSWWREQFLYNNCFYHVTGEHTKDEKKLLIMDAFDAERKKFERLKSKFSDNFETKYERPRIPENVRVEVWRRDQGQCAKCGSREKLEYDHILPISKGGGNTARNIELLCEKCNREKGAKIQ